jgi:hypothetical protein
LPFGYGAIIGSIQMFFHKVVHLTKHGLYIHQNVEFMSTNTLSKEAETRLLNFFNNAIEPEDMAKAIRQLNYILALGVLRKDKTLQNQIINLENSFYWLNELAEILSPYLDLE